MADRTGMKTRLHLSTIGGDSDALAKKLGVGLEIADFCWAYNIDNNREKNEAAAKEKMNGVGSFWFHAPFAELAPCAIDPRVRDISFLRYRQSVDIAQRLGIDRLVIHGGFVPFVYFPEHYVEQSIKFFKELMREIPKNINIALENVMEPDPNMLIDIVQGVDDERLWLCLDIGHANCRISTLPPIDWIDPMAKYLKHVHIHNNAGENDSHSPLGEGSIPMEAVLDKLLESCPNTTFTLENPHCAQSVEWLKAKGYI